MILGVYTPTFFLENETISEIVRLTEQWCKKNIGRNGKRKKLKVEIKRQMFWEKAFYGLYDEEINTIYLYKNRCLTIEYIIRCMLHEYTHYMQDLEHYETLTEKYGYESNPLEIEAIEMSEYYINVWKEIKNKI
jgi:hypothetical protein